MPGLRARCRWPAGGTRSRFALAQQPENAVALYATPLTWFRHQRNRHQPGASAQGMGRQRIQPHLGAPSRWARARALARPVGAFLNLVVTSAVALTLLVYSLHPRACWRAFAKRVHRRDRVGRPTVPAVGQRRALVVLVAGHGRSRTIACCSCCGSCPPGLVPHTATCTCADAVTMLQIRRLGRCWWRRRRLCRVSLVMRRPRRPPLVTRTAHCLWCRGVSVPRLGGAAVGLTWCDGGAIAFGRFVAPATRWMIPLAWLVCRAPVAHRAAGGVRCLSA